MADMGRAEATKTGTPTSYAEKPDAAAVGSSQSQRGAVSPMAKKKEKESMVSSEHAQPE